MSSLSKKGMPPNAMRGSIIHSDHFNALHRGSEFGDGWEIYKVNKQLNLSGLRPDWIIINRMEKRALIIDITSKFNPKHVNKGGTYIKELEKELADPSYSINYIEDYWLNAWMM